MLNEKLSNEFKDRFVIIKKANSRGNLITFLCDIDANIKRINKQSHLRAKQNTSATITTKPLFKTANFALAPTFTKLFTLVGVIVTSSIPNMATEIHPSPIHVFIAGCQEPISEEEKDRRNHLGPCHYCSKPGHIAIDHKDSFLLTLKRQASNITNHSMAQMSYTPYAFEEKELSLS